MKIIKKLIAKLLKLLPKAKRSESETDNLNGVLKDPEDIRDYPIVGLVYPVQTEQLPPKYSLPIDAYSFVKNQGLWNSCASHAICTAIEICHTIDKTNLEIPLSERFHYWRVRQPDYMNNFPNNDGQYSRDMLKVAQEVGISPEKLCPYISSDMNAEPGVWAKGFADLWKIRNYYRLFTAEDVKRTLTTNHPVLVGFYVTDSFLSKKGPIITTEAKVYGGHEVVIYGYDDETQEFLCINSWGTGYKDFGLMRVPYVYFDMKRIDTWTITR